MRSTPCLINLKTRFVINLIRNHTTSEIGRSEKSNDLIIWFCEDAVAAWNHSDDGKRKRESLSTYQALEAHEKRFNQSRRIKAIIPPNTGFQEARETDSAQSLSKIQLIEDKGKLSWQNEMDYGRRARVENTMHRYKSIIGNKLRSRTFRNQNTEVQIAARILNRMTQPGIPKPEKPHNFSQNGETLSKF